MDSKPFSRNEIASRSRKRQQIKKEEADKLGVVQKVVWMSKDQLNALEQNKINFDEAVAEGLSLLLGCDCDLPMKEIEENAFIRAKQVGL